MNGGMNSGNVQTMLGKLGSRAIHICGAERPSAGPILKHKFNWTQPQNSWTNLCFELLRLFIPELGQHPLSPLQI